MWIRIGSAPLRAAQHPENEQLKCLLPERSARFRTFVNPYQRISGLQGNQPLIGTGEAIAIRQIEHKPAVLGAEQRFPPGSLLERIAVDEGNNARRDKFQILNLKRSPTDLRVIDLDQLDRHQRRRSPTQKNSIPIFRYRLEWRRQGR
jgi:hypothetical protein